MKSKKINKNKIKIKPNQKSFQKVQSEGMGVALDIVTFEERNVKVSDDSGNQFSKKVYFLQGAITLQEYLALIISAKGTFQPFGKAFNPDPINPGMEITIEYMVPGENQEQFNKSLEELVIKKNKQTKDAKKVNKN
jgi:hypothetical protein